MKKILFFTIILAASSNLVAGQKYNPHENRWETVPDNYNIKYNPHSNTWSYQPDNATIEYNPHENTWDWNSGHNER